MSEVPIEDQRELACVRDRMAHFVTPSVTPISAVTGIGSGEALGTGNYLLIGGVPHIVTANHVVVQAAGRTMAHMGGPTDDFIAIRSPFIQEPRPIDLAFAADHAFPSIPRLRQALAPEYLDERYQPVEHELLFFLGFKGTTAGRDELVQETQVRHSAFGILNTPGFPCLLQAAPKQEIDDSGFQPQIHVLVMYPFKAVSSPGGEDVHIPNPGGFSGSFLWDTKYRRSMERWQNWIPQMARVCGLVWGATTDPDRLFATRVECLRPFLSPVEALARGQESVVGSTSG